MTRVGAQIVVETYDTVRINYSFDFQFYMAKEFTEL